MSYTFDEAIEQIDVLSSINFGWGLSPEVVKQVIESLRDEYAPTIEMTQEQYDVLGELDIDIIKQVLLHPETVKVVEDK